MSSIKFDEAGFTVKDGTESKRVKVGIFNIPRLIKIIDQFQDAEFTLTIEYQELVGEGETQFAAEKNLLKSKMLKMSVDCKSLNIFKANPLFPTLGRAAITFKVFFSNFNKFKLLSLLNIKLWFDKVISSNISFGLGSTNVSVY